jgi:hypothetical protein
MGGWRSWYTAEIGELAADGRSRELVVSVRWWHPGTWLAVLRSLMEVGRGA